MVDSADPRDPFGPHPGPTLPEPGDGLADTLSRSRQAMVDRILKGSCVIALIGAPASALRSLETGWLPLYGIHILLGVVVVAAYLARHRLSVPVKTAVLMLLFWSVGMAGLLTLGLIGAGVWWLVISALLVSILYSVREGTIVVGTILVILAVVGTAYSQGWLHVEIDANAYVRSATSWLVLIIGTALMPVIIFSAVAGMHATTLDLLMEVERQREQIRAMALRDSLTGLPNRELLADRLSQAMRAMKRDTRGIAVIFVDLDGFKDINDRYGHAAGDHVLRVVAQRLSSVLRPTDTVGRLGGDEFLAIMVDADPRATSLAASQRLIASMSPPIDFHEGGLSLSASIGIALATTHDADPERLIELADAAMYAAKRRGPGRVEIAEDETSELARSGS